jgi:ABC-type glycerol-3-phosphate transport system substrate-binding protein
MRKLSILLALAMTLSLFLAACGESPAGSGADGPTVSSASDSSAEASSLAGEPAVSEDEEIIKLTVWRPTKSSSGLAELDYGKTKIGALNVEKDKVDFVVHYVTGDADTEFNLKVADGNWEDLIVIGKDDVKVGTLVENEAVLPLNRYFEDAKNYPNLAAIPKEALEFWRQSDGNIYQVPHAWHDEGAPVFWMAAGWYIHPGIAEQAGVDYTQVQTAQDMLDFLTAVKNAGLKNSDGLDIIPLSSGENLDGINTLLSTFGIDSAGTGFMKVDGQWVHYRDNPQYKEAMKWMNSLHRAGVLDAEYTSLTNDQLVERLMGSRVAVTLGNAWPFWSAVTGGESPVTALEPVKFPNPDGVAKNGVMTTYNPYGSGAVLLSADTQYADRIMKWMDYYAEPGKYRDWEGLNGPLGKVWAWDESRGGEPYFMLTDEEVLAAKNAGDYNQIESLGWQVNNFVAAPYKYDLNEYIADNEGLFWIFKMNTFNSLPENRYYEKIRDIDRVTLPNDGQYVANDAALKDVDKQFRASLITAGSDDEFEAFWADYMNQLEIKGKWADVKAELMALYEDIA